MQFSDNQIKFMKERITQNKRILGYKPSNGLLILRIEISILQLLIKIHEAA